MPVDQGPLVQSALLRSELVRLRRESGSTQEQVAAQLEWSPSKLIRAEGGRSSITKVDLDALLSRYGVTSESTRERLQLLNRGARERGWWDRYRDDVSPTYLNYVGLEAGAACIRQFQSGFVPGLLQTAEVCRGGHRQLGRRDPGGRDRRAPPAAPVRAGAAGSRPGQYYVVDEAVIRRHVGIAKDPDIMPSQLREIADKAEQDDLVTVRVIPFEAGAHLGLCGPFSLLEFDGGFV